MAGFDHISATGPLDVATTRGTAAEPAGGPPVTYVGAVRGTRALVGIANVNGRVRAYVCDSRHVASWFDGRLKAGAIALRSGPRQRLSGTVHRTSASGTITLVDGRTHTFRAAIATGRAGLYRGSAHGYTVGWILQSLKDQRGAIRANGTGVLTPAPLLTQTALGDGKISITPIPIPNIGSFSINFTSAGGLTAATG